MTGSVEQRIADRQAARGEEFLRSAAGFPSYEVPAFVAERFPEFRPGDPSTWPEPDKCTEGRPWGHSSYAMFGTANGGEDRWRRYLAAADAAPRQNHAGRSFVNRDKGCRNRWRYEDSRLCGTHDRPWREAIENARKRVRRHARELENRDLAKRLAAYGIEADGHADAVRLQADAVRELLRLLAAGAPFPTTDLATPPPL